MDKWTDINLLGSNEDDQIVADKIYDDQIEENLN